MNITHEHKELYRTVKKFVEEEINPNIDEWEKAGIWPAHEVLKKMGSLGLLGVNKPEAGGGMGLDYYYHLMFVLARGHFTSGSFPVGVGVETAMATPSL